jgi:hypothetical protein
LNPPGSGSPYNKTNVFDSKNFPRAPPSISFFFPVAPHRKHHSLGTSAIAFSIQFEIEKLSQMYNFWMK